MLANRKALGQAHFIEETVSGRVPWRRRKLAEILEKLQSGDTLVVSAAQRTSQDE